MQNEQFPKKLVQVAKELNLPTKTITSYLIENGFDVVDKPTSRISEEMFEVLGVKFLGSEICFDYSFDVKSTTYEISYRKAFDIEDIDEIFCSIIYEIGKEGALEKQELALILGFSLFDLAEAEIFEHYLKSVASYNLLINNKETVQITS